MTSKRIDYADAEQIPNARIFYFDCIPDGRADIAPEQFYRVVANGSDIGVIISDYRIDGFEKAPGHYKIGRAGGESGSAVFFVPPHNGWKKIQRR